MVRCLPIPNLLSPLACQYSRLQCRGRRNCGKLRATSNGAGKPVIRSFPSAVRTVEKQLRALAIFSSRTSCFSTVYIVRQFPRPAFDWRHLPVYRMNQRFWRSQRVEFAKRCRTPCLAIVEKARQRNRLVASPPVGQMGVADDLSSLVEATPLVVVEDGQVSSSPSCLDLASQAPSANVAVFTFQCTKALRSCRGRLRSERRSDHRL